MKTIGEKLINKNKEVFYHYVRLNGVRKVYRDDEFEKMIHEFNSIYQEKLPGNIVTVCLIDNGSKVARGISACSRADTFDYHKGLSYARNYALHALKGREEVKAQSEKAVQIFLNTRCPFDYHSKIANDLSIFEKRILWGKKMKREVSTEILINSFGSTTNNKEVGCTIRVFNIGRAMEDIKRGDALKFIDGNIYRATS